MANETKRYLVEWTPWADVLAAAKKAGMPDGGSPGDYIDFADFDVAREIENFPLAVIFARAILDNDTWKCPRIRRQVLVPNDRDDLGNRVEAIPSYETEATWEVSDGQPDPVEANPDWLEDAA